MSLQEVMQYAMAHARVLQDLGGTLLRTPESVSTTYDVAVVETDPQYGPEAALSAFDAQLSSSLLFQKNLQQFNNQQIGNNGFYEQTFDNFQAQITKQSVTGDQFTLQHTVDWDSDNYLSNQFKGGNWDTLTEAQVRHPFLQGGGVDFNRIAGPARPGVYNGVLVARMKTDISLADFQIGLRNYVSNLENAYWDLYFAYRDLDTKIKARDDALEIWRNINALHQVNRRGGEADKEAQARGEYFQFEEEVYNALVGRQLQGTQTDNGSTPGTFRPLPGVRTAERRLDAAGAAADRWPPDPPQRRTARLLHHVRLGQLSRQAICQREELRRQRWIVKTHELELAASHNFLQPNLDLVGRYGLRGFGTNSSTRTRRRQPFDSAYRSMVDSDYPEWQAGLEFSMPMGFRDAHPGVRNAELRLTQARVLLREQELQIVNSLTGRSTKWSGRSCSCRQASITRLAARDQLTPLQAAYEADKTELFRRARRPPPLCRGHVQLLPGPCGICPGGSQRSLGGGVGWIIATSPSAEGPWPRKAYADAAMREHLRGQPRRINFTLRRPPLVSQGPWAQPVSDGVVPGSGAPGRADCGPSPP